MLQELRHGLRVLLAAPGFTFAALLSLALAIGSITTIFAAVDLVLLRPLPYQDADRLVAVWERDLAAKPATQKGNVPPGLLALSGPDFRDFQAKLTSFTGLAAFFPWNATISDGTHPEKVDAAVVSTNLFDLLGVKPILGRTFLPGEAVKGRDKVVMIGYGLWQTWGRDARILGRMVHLEGDSYEVVGVMPRGFDFPNGHKVWKPLVLPDIPRNFNFLKGVARLAPGVELRTAQAELDTLTAGFARQYPDTNRDRGAWATPWRHQVVGDFRQALVILLAAVAFLLLIACANVSNLLLARATTRGEEVAVRVALGAGRARLLRQLLGESLLLAVLGGGLGALLAGVGYHLLEPFLVSRLPGIEDAGLDWRILAFTILASLGTAALFGLAPALQAVRTDLVQALRPGWRTLKGGFSERLQQLTVVLQVAIALTLVIGAGLLIESFTRLTAVDPGFNADRVLTMELNLMPESKYGDGVRNAAVFQRLLSRIASLPGVKSAGASWRLPLTNRAGTAEVEIPGRVPPAGHKDEVAVDAATPDYFRAVGIPVLKGRAFTERDDANGPPVVIVNAAMAQLFWPERDPVGQKMTFFVDFGPAGKVAKATREVVGVAGNTRTKGLNQDVEPVLYFPIYQGTWRWIDISVLTGMKNPATLFPAIADEMHRIDPDLALGKVKTAQQLIADSVAQPRLSTWVLSCFAGIALLLAAVGIYGVISYLVARRTREIGIRMALGSPRAQVLRLVLRRAMGLALSGIAIGLAAALALTRLLSSLLFGVKALDVPTFAGVTVLLVSVAALAGYLPARRATRVDPLGALRIE